MESFQASISLTRRPSQNKRKRILVEDLQGARVCELLRNDDEMCKYSKYNYISRPNLIPQLRYSKFVFKLYISCMLSLLPSARSVIQLPGSLLAPLPLREDGSFFGAPSLGKVGFSAVSRFSLTGVFVSSAQVLSHQAKQKEEDN